MAGISLLVIVIVLVIVASAAYLVISQGAYELPKPTPVTKPTCEEKNYVCVDSSTYKYETWCNGEFSGTVAKSCSYGEECKNGKCVEKPTTPTQSATTTTTTTTTAPVCEEKNYNCIDSASYKYETWCNGILDSVKTKYCSSGQECKDGKCITQNVTTTTTTAAATTTTTTITCTFPCVLGSGGGCICQTTTTTTTITEVI